MLRPIAQLIGREREREILRETFARGTRLVTISGAAGIGKTHLAHTIADDIEDHQVVWVDLRDASAATILPRMTEALGVDAHTYDALIAGALEQDDVFCVLDDVPDDPGLRQKIDSFVRALPDSRFLATAHAALGSEGEQVLRLRPLPLPTESDADNVAVRLFLTRRGDLGAAVSDLDAVVALVQALEGIPLAIVLAATRSREVTPREILAELDQGLGPLQASIQRSIQRVSASAVTALECLAAFAGSFTTEAAQHVLGEASTSALEELSRRSLVERTTVDQETQWRLLRPVREAVRCPANAKIAHATYFLKEADASIRAAHIEEVGAALEVILREPIAPSLRSLVFPSLRNAYDAFSAQRFAAQAARVVELADATTSLTSVERAMVSAFRFRLAMMAGRVSEAVDEAMGAIETFRTTAHEEAAAWLAAEVASAADLFPVEVLDSLSEIVEELGQTDDGFSLHLARVRFARAYYFGRSAEIATAAERVAALESHGGPLAHARGRWLHAVGLLSAGELTAAERLSAQVAEVAAQHGWDVLEARSLTIAAIARCVRRESGALEIARGAVRVAERSRARAGSWALLYAGLIAAVAREASESQALIAAALTQLQGSPRVRSVAVETAAIAGDLDARAQLAVLPPTQLRPLVDAVVKLQRGRGDRDEVNRARDTLADELDNLPPFLRPDAMLALLVADLPGPGSEPARLRLEVGLNAAWFRVGDDEPVDLSRARAARRVFRALLEADESLDIDALFSFGWPGQRIGALSARNRVHVTLARLRKLGLRDTIVRDENGWQLVADIVRRAGET
ncbi:MAG: AAA family ATPase [Myxococcota bacterium]